MLKAARPTLIDLPAATILDYTEPARRFLGFKPNSWPLFELLFFRIRFPELFKVFKY